MISLRSCEFTQLMHCQVPYHSIPKWKERNQFLKNLEASVLDHRKQSWQKYLNEQETCKNRRERCHLEVGMHFQKFIYILKARMQNSEIEHSATLSNNVQDYIILQLQHKSAGMSSCHSLQLLPIQQFENGCPRVERWVPFLWAS